MKIFYAVQATGNGHISRASEILPHLKQYGDVDIFLSGSNSALAIGEDVKFRSKGMSLFYSGNGSLSYSKIAASLAPLRLCREVRDLPVEKYDLVINDFESITALACAYKKVQSINFGHQASFMSDKTPRPEKKNFVGEFILKYYARASRYAGLHFEQYDHFILPPVIKQEVRDVEPTDMGHITVYLLSYSDKTVAKYLSPLRSHRFEVFSAEVKTKVQTGNITFLPVDKMLFAKSMTTCKGIITGAGFETPAEAMFLNKKIMALPVKGQYEQYCNAAALERLGVVVLKELNDDFAKRFEQWISGNNVQKQINYRSTQSIISEVMHIAAAPAPQYVLQPEELQFI